MVTQLIQTFQQKFSTTTEPLIIKSPGRINLIGEHTDYNNGFVLPAAIDKAMYFAMSPSDDQDNIYIRSIDFDDAITLSITEQNTASLPSWGNYLNAIIELLNEKGITIKGTNVIFGGDIPIGSGMSSSAALCCGFIFGLSQLYDLALQRSEIALIAQAAEHRIGLNCGLMDQYAVLFGKDKKVLLLNCGDLTYDHFSIDTGDYEFVLINSKVEHQLAVDSEYNKRRMACEAVVAEIKKEHPTITSLSDINQSTLTQYKDRLDPDHYVKANFVLEENQRVQDTVKALKRGDIEEVGALIFASHKGLSEEYEVSISQLDKLVELAHEAPSIIGARMMGGGFGGCTINLIHRKDKEAVLHNLMQAYKAATGIQAESYPVTISDGVNAIEKVVSL